MKDSKTRRAYVTAMQIGVFMLLFSLLPLAAYSDNTEAIVKFKPEYKIKRLSNGTVTIFTLNETGEKKEYVFKDFNADVVLSIYRHVNVNQITSTLARKYYISEEDSRRGIKRVLNILGEWGMVTE